MIDTYHSIVSITIYCEKPPLFLFWPSLFLYNYIFYSSSRERPVLPFDKDSFLSQDTLYREGFIRLRSLIDLHPRHAAADVVEPAVGVGEVILGRIEVAHGGAHDRNQALVAFTIAARLPVERAAEPAPDHVVRLVDGALDIVLLPLGVSSFSI